MSIRELTDEEIAEIDKDLPKLAEKAFRDAYKKALATRGKVLEAVTDKVDGKLWLVESYKDGTQRRIRELEAPTKVRGGGKVRLRLKSR